MVKTPIEYFEEQEFAAGDPNAAMSEAEEKFVKKYLGNNVNVVSADHAEKIFDYANLNQEKVANIDEAIKKLDEVLLVSFILGKQEYTIPIIAVQEVIRYMTPSRLPLGPKFVTGAINLRGHVSPVIDLALILEEKKIKTVKAGYIIICGTATLQIGLQIDKILSLYRAKQDEIKWNVEAQIGVSANYLSGLYINGERIISIVSIDKILSEI